MRIPPILLWTMAVFGLILAAGVWVVLVRPVRARSDLGTIIGKTFQAAQTYTRVRSGPRREFWSEEKIPIPDSYLFAIRLDDTSEVNYRLNAAAAADFDTGQRVKLLLEERSIPLVWKRLYVREMAPAGVSHAMLAYLPRPICGKSGISCGVQMTVENAATTLSFN